MAGLLHPLASDELEPTLQGGARLHSVRSDRCSPQAVLARWGAGSDIRERQDMRECDHDFMLKYFGKTSIHRTYVMCACS